MNDLATGNCMDAEPCEIQATVVAERTRRAPDPVHSAAGPPSLIGILLYRWPTLTAVSLCATAALLALVFHFVRPMYEVSATLHINPKVRSILNSDPEADMTHTYRQFVGTEAANLLSSAVLSAAVNTTEVRGIPDVAEAIDPVAVLQEWIEVEQVRGTELLEVRMKGLRPEPLVAIVNNVVNSYISWREEAQRKWDEQVLASLKAEQAELEPKLKMKARQLRETAVDQGLGGAEGSGFVVDQWIREVQQLSTQSIKQRSMADDQLRKLEDAENPIDASALDPRAFETYAAQDPELQSLRQELRNVELAALSDRSLGRGPQHPEVQTRPALVEALRSRIAEREQRLREVFTESHRRALHATIYESDIAAKVYEEELNRLNEQRAAISGQQFVLGDLVHEREQIERSLRLVREKMWNVEVEQHRAARISVASYARIPPAPNLDKRPKFAAVALLIGLCTGAGAAFLRNRADTSFHTPVEVSERLGVRVLGTVRHVGKDEQSVGGLDARLMEPIRGISTALLAASPPSKTHVRLITSPTPASGKSSLSVNLARSLAATGRRVLLVDADNHGQGASRRLELLGKPGLTEFLKGTSEAEPLLQNGFPNLSIMPAGSRSELFGEILCERSVQARLRHLFSHYDEVIVDSPPILAKSDAIILATIVNEVVLVLRAGTSRTSETHAAQQYLSTVGASVVGVILNGVNPRTLNYGYGYGYGYGSPYGSPYATKAHHNESDVEI